MTTDKLTKALTEAAEAHHAYEATLGHPDANWQRWYASWIIDKYGQLRDEDVDFAKKIYLNNHQLSSYRG